MIENPQQSVQAQQLIDQAFHNLKIAKKDSHKGQNGKLLIIGGSKLFHAASKWSLEVASKIVDMVFYSSVPSNNRLIKKWISAELDHQLTQAVKENFWQGIVIDRRQIEDYLDEADCILLGPGMERTNYTAKLSNKLLKKFPQKKWVIDAGALQMVDPHLLSQNCIITPHQQEMDILVQKNQGFAPNNYQALPICLLKGPVDRILISKNHSLSTKTTLIEITGGNAGMTKGGTGDVLAGLLAALYCQNDALTSTIIASYINKKAGDSLYKSVGPYFNASDLVAKIPQVLWETLQEKA
ncbi:NAD(P)H-hydrate dehydratase [Candidatus Woesebacteria bacterium]|jgi:NAD(P)H-hydrate epimerase|nr:NAD(P)H-hydrate dehydratase [Candidatus Woesebacteria bacterium]